MKLLFYIIIALCYTCLGNVALAQSPSTNKKAQAAYQNAAKFLTLHEKAKAIDELQRAIVLDPDFATAYQQLADIYRSEKKYKSAIPLYQKVLQIAPNLTTLTLFGLGESQLANGNYESAFQNLKQYSKGNLSDKSRHKVDKHLKDCEFALRQMPDLTVKIKKMPNSINTDKDEYFPKLTADAKRVVFTRKQNNQENFFESVFVNDNWATASKLAGHINSDLFNEGAHSISPDGKYLFFTGCNRPNGMGSCDIYVSKLENGNWSIPYNLGSPINSKGWEAQPAISSDGRTLYFVSNRPGGFGGSDIWKSELSDGKWQEPQNLGSKINSMYDERSPYIHADNKTLYFASEGWPGFGQFDLYKTQLDSLGQWSIPTNLGAPINNNYDQTSIHVTMNGTTGYISASDATGQLDIYALNIPNTMQPIPVAYIQGGVYDADTKLPLSATISVTNTQSKEIVYRNESDYNDGKFIATLPVGANYAVHVIKEGYLFESKQYNTSDKILKDEVFASDVYLQSIKEGIVVPLNNIYFDTDSAIPLKSSDTELQLILSFMQTNPSIAIEIAGHTDNTGQKLHNQKLSQNRATAISAYLITNGIHASRLVSKGYGDTRPIADNSTIEGRQQNRRTEVLILKK